VAAFSRARAIVIAGARAIVIAGARAIVIAGARAIVIAGARAIVIAGARAIGTVGARAGTSMVRFLRIFRRVRASVSGRVRAESVSGCHFFLNFDNFILAQRITERGRQATENESN
jgi:hypothetical protein